MTPKLGGHSVLTFVRTGMTLGVHGNSNSIRIKKLVIATNSECKGKWQIENCAFFVYQNQINHRLEKEPKGGIGCQRILWCS